MINPQDLQYFMTVAKTGNMTRASEQIGLAQPSLSLAIKRVEDELGEKVFTRTKRGVFLTPVGKDLLKHSMSLYNQWSSVKEDILLNHKEVRGRYSLGCHSSVASYTLHKFLPKLLIKNSKLEFDLVHHLSRRITEKIISFELDFGIVVNPTAHPDLIIHKLYKDEVKVWKSRKKHDEETLIVDPSLIQSQSLLKKLKLNTKRIIHSSSLENIAKLCLEGVGLGIIPETIAKSEGKGKLVELDRGPIFKDEISFVYRMENKNLPIVKEIKDCLAEIDF